MLVSVCMYVFMYVRYMNVYMYVRCIYLSAEPLHCNTAGLTSFSVNSFKTSLFTAEFHCIRLKNKKYVCMLGVFLSVRWMYVCLCAECIYAQVLDVCVYMYVCVQGE